jgi:hypothetical protein
MIVTLRSNPKLRYISKYRRKDSRYNLMIVQPWNQIQFPFLGLFTSNLFAPSAFPNRAKSSAEKVNPAAPTGVVGESVVSISGEEGKNPYAKRSHRDSALEG